MLTAIIIGFAILMLGAIIYLSEQARTEIKTRPQFLEALTDFLDGEMNPMEGREDSFQINFSFEGEKFIFEDIMEKSFTGVINKGYLKVTIPLALSLDFSEKKRLGVQSKMVIASQIGKEGKSVKEALKLPDALKVFDARTNNPAVINEFFENNKVAQIFSDYVNKDYGRGYHFMPFKIIGGTIILEFYELPEYRPNLPSLKNNVPSIEDFLDQLLVMVEQLKY